MLTEVVHDDEKRPIGLRLFDPTVEEFELMAQIIEQGPQIIEQGPLLPEDGAGVWRLMPAVPEPDISLGSGEHIG